MMVTNSWTPHQKSLILYGLTKIEKFYNLKWVYVKLTQSDNWWMNCCRQFLYKPCPSVYKTPNIIVGTQFKFSNNRAKAKKRRMDLLIITWLKRSLDCWSIRMFPDYIFGYLISDEPLDIYWNILNIKFYSANWFLSINKHLSQP